MFRGIFTAKTHKKQALNTDKKCNGYTLIEVMMSMVMFCVVSIALSYPLIESISLSADDHSIVTANNLAKHYLRDVEASWRTQNDFDASALIDSSNCTYTDGGKYNISVTPNDIQNNGTTVLRRLNIRYTTPSGKILTDLFYDINRP